MAQNTEELMNNLSLCTLYSGSKGNCIHIRAGEDEILIDAGRSLRALASGLCAVGSDLSRIRAIFITHEHSDHISALEMLCKRYKIPVHMTSVSAARLLKSTVYIRQNLVEHAPLFSADAGALHISSFRTPHDSEMSVGYTVHLPDGRKIGIATDIGRITDEIRENLLGSETVVIESNHDRDMLESGPYPAWLKQRIRSATGHLSNDECSAFLPELIEKGTRNILLAHLSAENNTPETALACARRSCPNSKILAACESAPTKLL